MTNRDFPTHSNRDFPTTRNRDFPIISIDDAEVDPDFSNVALLVSWNGTNGQTSSVDHSNNNYTLNFEADAQLDTAQKKFGLSSLLLDGNDDIVSILDDPGQELGSSDFTIECFIRLNTLDDEQTIIARYFVDIDDRSFLCRVNGTSDTVEFVYSTDGTINTVSVITASWNPSTDTWYHIAFVRDGGNFYIFIDGSEITSSDTISGTLFDGETNLRIGCIAGGFVNTQFWNGWLDELRVTIGTARYTSNFTAPIQQFPRQ